jgi:hypothetical protein
MLDLCMNVPFGTRFVFLSWILLSNSAVSYVKDFRVYFIVGVKNIDTSVIFGVSSITFLEYLDYTCISSLLWNTVVCVYIIYKL